MVLVAIGLAALLFGYTLVAYFGLQRPITWKRTDDPDLFYLNENRVERGIVRSIVLLGAALRAVSQWSPHSSRHLVVDAKRMIPTIGDRTATQLPLQTLFERK